MKNPIQERYIRRVCEATGWTREKVLAEMQIAKEKTGASGENYAVYRFWELDEDQQKSFFTRGDVEKLQEMFAGSEGNAGVLQNRIAGTRRISPYLGRAWMPVRGITLASFIKTFGLKNKVFYKRVDGTGVTDIRIFDYDLESLEDTYETLKTLKPGLLEEVISQHEEMRKLSLNAVNTIHIATVMTKKNYRDLEAGHVYVMYACLKMAVGNDISDSPYRGGLLADIDLETGVLKTDGQSLFNQVFKVHPDTNCPIKGFKIPFFREACDMLKAAGKDYEGCLGWDIAVTENGPVIVKISPAPGAIYLQAPYIMQKVGMRPALEKYLKAELIESEHGFFSEDEDNNAYYRYMTAPQKDLKGLKCVKNAPTNSVIRKVMEATGWGSYAAYCRIMWIAKWKSVDYQTILKEKLWEELKETEAFALLKQELKNGDWLGSSDCSDWMDEETFYHYFFTEKQRKAIVQILSGQLTAQILFDYLKLELPENVKVRGDISNRIAFTPFQIKPGSIFLPIRKTDMVSETIRRKDPSCIISYPKRRELLTDLNIPYIPRSFVYSYVIDLAEIRRRTFRGKVVGITGSVGKTTTTEMIGNVLNSAFNMYKIVGNKNTTLQIARFIFNLNDKMDIYVQECAGAAPGQLENTSRMVKPDFFVITNVGNGHIGKFKGVQEFLLYEKLSLGRNSTRNAVGVINWDDQNLKKIAYQHRVISIAMKDQSADIVSENVIEKDGEITFDIVEHNSANRRTPVKLRVSGIHNVYNAMSAFAVGVSAGVPREKIVQALYAYKPRSVRQNLLWLGGQHLYIDCYSATVESMETAMRTMKTISTEPGRKKIALLGEVPDLGDISEEKHREIGRMTAEVNTADEVIFYGGDMKYAVEEASARGVCCRFTEDRQELESWLRAEADQIGLIVLKASHKVGFQWVLDDLFGTNYYCYDESTRFAPTVKEGPAVYKYIEGYGSTLIQGDKAAQEPVISDYVNGEIVRNIGVQVFQDAALCRIVLPDGLKCISEFAFKDAARLQEVEFSASLKYIGEEAFSGCSCLQKADLSKGCMTIAENAFAHCEKLEHVILPAELKTIADNAFPEDTKAVFSCPAGSYAEKWVIKKGFNVSAI